MSQASPSREDVPSVAKATVDAKDAKPAQAGDGADAQGGSPFDYSRIPDGFYHQILVDGTPLRRMWHKHKFERVLDCLPPGVGLSLLDMGCFAGSFLSLVPRERFSRQLGVDILDRQIAFARKNFGTPFREFRRVSGFGDLKELGETFDAVTLIEVIEHLDADQIRTTFEAIHGALKPGGTVIISTPNYTSTWPLIEVGVNLFSEVSYEEQHVTKFGFFSVFERLRGIYPRLDEQFDVKLKTTTHFITPFLAPLSMRFAERVSRVYPHQRWHFPFGNIIVMVLTKKG